MLAIAVFVCAFLLKKDAQKIGLDADIIFDLVFWVVVGGIIGARLFFILLNFSYFLQNPFEVWQLYKGGLAWQGGLIMGTAVVIFFIKRKKLPLGRTMDLLAPYVALGQAIGRIGCFLNGCCYGKEVSWGIYFPVHHARLHPTQLYSSFGLFLIFLFLKKFQSRKNFDGQVLVFYLILASLLRFIIEFFRGDHDIVIAGLSIFQLVCIGIFISAIYANIYFKSRR